MEKVFHLNVPECPVTEKYEERTQYIHYTQIKMEDEGKSFFFIFPFFFGISFIQTAIYTFSFSPGTMSGKLIYILFMANWENGRPDPPKHHRQQYPQPN